MAGRLTGGNGGRGERGWPRPPQAASLRPPLPAGGAVGRLRLRGTWSLLGLQEEPSGGKGLFLPGKLAAVRQGALPGLRVRALFGGGAGTAGGGHQQVSREICCFRAFPFQVLPL